MCRHLVLAHEALVGAAVALGHAVHDQVLAVDPGDAHVAARVDDFPVAVPGQLLVLGPRHAAGQGHLAADAALDLARADGGF